MANPQVKNKEASDEWLSKKLSQYEAACIESEGKAKQLRKERDVERSDNEKLRKKVDKLSNQLLCERTRISSLEKDVKLLESCKENLEKEECADSSEDSRVESKPISGSPAVESEEFLASRLDELQSAIDSMMDRQRCTKKTADQLIALSVLIQTLKNYLEIEEKECNGIEGNSSDYEPLYVQSAPSKKEISKWFRIAVFLGPVFLSILCYIAFNTGQR